MHKTRVKICGLTEARHVAAAAEAGAAYVGFVFFARSPRNLMPAAARALALRRWAAPWMLAGGLTPDNVGEAIRLTGARQVDVSSGVETAPGMKDEGLIRAFIAAAQGERP